MAGMPGLCILLNTTGRDDGVECGNATLVSAPAATAHVGAGDTAVVTISADVWSAGAVIAAAVHLALPLRMQESWGSTQSVGPDGLVEMSSYVTETSRTGTGRVLGSTSVRFYRLAGRRGLNGTWVQQPPTNASDIGAGRAEVAELLKSSPEGRLGMVIVYNGPRADRYVPTDDSDVEFAMPTSSMVCGAEVGSLRFGVRLSGRANFASAVSEASGQALDVLQTIGTVTAMVTLLPTVVLQLGVQGSIREMAECQGWWIDMEEEGVGAYRLADLVWLSGNKLQQLSSPYGMGVASLGATGHEWVAGQGSSNSSGLIQPARDRAVSELESMGQYYRGAIMTSLINLCVFSIIVAGAVCVVFTARHVAKVDNPHVSRAQNILDAAALVQVPSVFLVGLSLLMDGLAEGSTTLMSIRIQFAAEPDGYASVYRTTALEAGVPGQTLMSGIDGHMVVPGWTAAGYSDMVLCAAALALMTGFILHVLYVVPGSRLAVVVVPMEHIVAASSSSSSIPASTDAHPQPTAVEADDLLLGKSDTDDDDALSTAEDTTTPAPLPPSPPSRWKALWLYWFELREHWVPPGDEFDDGPAYEAGVSWMRKYGMYVGGTIWAPYTVMELSIAFVVTGLEGVVSSNTTWCAVKCAIAVVLLCVQLGVLVLMKPLSARFDHILTTASVLLSLAVGILITVNIIVQDVAIAIAADMLTVFASLTVTVFGIVGVINGIVAIVDVVRTVLEALRNRRRREEREAKLAAEGGDDDEELQLPELDDDIPQNLHDSGLGEDIIEAEPTPEEEKQLWDGYLDELETAPVQPYDEEGVAMRDAILPPDVLPGDDNSKEPDPSLELLTDVLAAKEEEEEDWDAFLRDLDREEQDN